MNVEMEESVVGKKQDDTPDTSICQRYCFIIHPKDTHVEREKVVQIASGMIAFLPQEHHLRPGLWCRSCHVAMCKRKCDEMRCKWEEYAEFWW